MSDSEAVDAWNRAVTAFLAHGAATPAHLGDALAREPGFAMGHAVKGMFYALLARRELTPAIAEALRTARAALAAGGGDARAAMYVEALSACREERFAAAAAILGRVQAAYPRDALAMKLGHALRFILGDAAGMRAALEGAEAAFGADHPHLGYLLGCRAFAFEETGDYAEAERLGRQGLEMAADDAWGLHAVAHVYDMTGRAEEGVRWLSGKSKRWEHCNNFGYHVWWHLALFYLDKGATTLTLELYDERVRPKPTDDFRDIANAASLLTRLEIEGVDVGDRWEELGALCANRVEDGCLIFADVHYLIALNRTGRRNEADRLAARIAMDAQNLGHDQHEVAKLAGLPLARGLNAFREGDYTAACRFLTAAGPDRWRIGGSHAQRDVIERICIEAAMRAGELDEAERLLAARNAARGGEDGYTARRIEAIMERRAMGGLAAE
jgi:hypothetical protein